MRALINKCAITLLLLLILGVAARAQPSWQWGKSGGSIGDNGSSEIEDVKDMATDTKGNLYVLGTVYSTAIVEGHTGISTFDRLVVASWSCNGDFRWIKFLGSGSSCIGKSLRTDTLGGVYVAGAMYSSFTIGGPGYFDADSVLDYNTKAMFVIKYDTAGVLQWLKMPQPDTVSFGVQSFIYDMDVAGNGDIYLYCKLTPGLYDNGSFTIDSDHLYVLKYNAHGFYQNVVPLEIMVSGPYSSNYGYANASLARFSRDPLNGRYYLCGRCDTAYFGYMKLGNTDIITPLYLGCFDSNGDNLWARQCVGNPYNAGYASSRAVTDADENVYIGGVIYSGDAWNGYLIDNDSFTTLVNSCPFVAKMDKDGNNIWVTNAESSGSHNYLGIALANNIIACTGQYEEFAWDGFHVAQPATGSPLTDNFMARINATTGALIGLDSLKSSFGFAENPNAIASDKNGNFFVGGRFQYDLFVAQDVLTTTGGYFDWFIAKYGSPYCDCTVPSVDFNAVAALPAVNFTYTGGTPVDSVTWDFGDGASGNGTTTSHTYTGAGTYTVCATAYNTCGYNLVCKTVNTNTTGIQSTPGLSNTFIYPNPAGSIVNIEHALPGSKLEISNILGQPVLKTKLTGSKAAVDISGLDPGVYSMCFISQDGQKGTIKLIKQ